MEKHIKMWLQKGLIDVATSQRLLENIKQESVQTCKVRFNILIYTLAAICLGIGVIAFVVANDWIWKIFNRKPIVRIVFLFGSSVISLVSGYILSYKKNKFPSFGRSLIFCSSLLFGSGLILVWYTYSIKNHLDVLMFLWLFFIFPLACKFKDKYIHNLSNVVFLGGVVFLFTEHGMSNIYNVGFIAPIAAGAFLYTLGRFFTQLNGTYKAWGLIAIFFALLNMAILRLPVNSVNVFWLGFLMFLLICNLYLNKLRSIEMIEGVLLVAILAIVIGLSIFSKVPNLVLGIISNALIISILGVGFKQGYKNNCQDLVQIMNFFAIVYLGLSYFRLGWNRFQGSVFFIIGGVILFAVGIFLEKNRKKQKQTESKAI